MTHEIMYQDPREVALVTLEIGVYEVVGNNWPSHLDMVFVEKSP